MTGQKFAQTNALAETEAAFHAAWTGKASTPFIADIQVSKTLLDKATSLVRSHRHRTIFNRYPTLAIWSVLYPLSRNYGGATKDVYLHISQFVGESYDDVTSRDTLKYLFRTTARSLGLPVSGNDPTSLFFAPLGPARAQHGDLARAFVGAALHLGPPAIEDTSAARAWQRRAVVERCPTLTRLRESIFFDTSAHCARQFEAWRQGAIAQGEAEADLFAVYDRAAALFGRGRTDLVGPPRIFWFGDNLGLEADRSRHPQTIRLGAFPTRMSGGQRIRVPTPWPEKIAWQAGTIRQDVAFAPAKREVIVFDADTGACIGRAGPEQDTMEVAAERLVVLSGSDFSSPGFDEAIPSRDPDVMVAWVASGEVLTFKDRADLSLPTPDEDAIWFDCTVLGRDGARALYASDGDLVLQINPEIGGSSRIVRARSGDDVRYLSIEIAAKEHARVNLSLLGFDQAGVPQEVIFDVLAPGAAGDPGARADLSTRAWIWPGVASPEGDLANVPTPENYEPARSAGLRSDKGRMSVDPRSDVEVPILGLRAGDHVHEFHLSARSEKLWHCRILLEDRVFVPRGGTISLGVDNRHDTLILRSPDRDASLFILGKQKRRPFIQRQSVEIGASELEPTEDGDDRIAIQRADGRMEILARLRRTDGSGSITCQEDEGHILLSVVPQRPFDGLRVRIEALEGPSMEGDYSFSHDPSELLPLKGVISTCDADSGRIDIDFDRNLLPSPARVLLYLREPSGGHVPLLDDHNAPVSIGLPGMPETFDLAVLTGLAKSLADPEPEALSGQLSSALTPAYHAAFASVGYSRMVGSVKPVLNVVRADGEAPRHDIIGVAPWIFEAQPTAFMGLADSSGLAPITQVRTICCPDPLPSLDGDTPLGDWLKRIDAEADLPEGLGPEALQRAFQLLRLRLRDSDLHDLIRDGTIGSTVKLICGPHIEGLDQIRTFDSNGGGDPIPARMAVQIERYARACAERRAGAFVDDIIFRTGLCRADVGRTLTMMLRAGIEFFVYFRALWGHANQQKTGSI